MGLQWDSHRMNVYFTIHDKTGTEQEKSQWEWQDENHINSKLTICSSNMNNTYFLHLEMGHFYRSGMGLD